MRSRFRGTGVERVARNNGEKKPKEKQEVFVVFVRNVRRIENLTFVMLCEELG